MDCIVQRVAKSRMRLSGFHLNQGSDVQTETQALAFPPQPRGLGNGADLSVCSLSIARV